MPIVFFQVKYPLKYVNFGVKKYTKSSKSSAFKQDQNWPIRIYNNGAILFMFLRKCLEMSLGCEALLGILLNAHPPPPRVILEQSYANYNKHMNYF